MKEEQVKSNYGCQIMDIRGEFEIRRCARKWILLRYVAMDAEDKLER